MTRASKLARLALAAPRGAAFSSLSAAAARSAMGASPAVAAALARAPARGALLPEAARALAAASSVRAAEPPRMRLVRSCAAAMLTRSNYRYATQRFHTGAAARSADAKGPAPHPGLKAAQYSDECVLRGAAAVEALFAPRLTAASC